VSSSVGAHRELRDEVIALAVGVGTFRLMPVQDTVAQTAADPLNTFLTTREVIARYRWGRTKGYEMLKSHGFPRSIGGAYRLDTLLDWEAAQLDGRRTCAPPTLPAKRRPGRPTRRSQAA
jgi:hypothetical protein